MNLNQNGSFSSDIATQNISGFACLKWWVYSLKKVRDIPPLLNSSWQVFPDPWSDPHASHDYPEGEVGEPVSINNMNCWYYSPMNHHCWLFSQLCWQLLFRAPVLVFIMFAEGLVSLCLWEMVVKCGQSEQNADLYTSLRYLEVTLMARLQVWASHEYHHHNQCSLHVLRHLSSVWAFGCTADAFVVTILRWGTSVWRS